MSGDTYVIVGASLTGAKAAETLRSEGFDGRVLLLGAEAERPYERPPLSKQYLRGERDVRPYVHDEAFYADNDIELRTGVEVTAIDPGGSTLTLADGEEIAFSKLLIATGAEPRRLDLPGVLTLRSVEDSDAIRERIDAGGRAVVIGAGWIGAEVAASARERGCEVTLLERGELPLEHVLGRELGTIYRDVHVEHGVEVVTDARVEGIGDAGVRLEDGRVFTADFVVAGIGVVPRVGLAQAAGLQVDNGILTDEFLQTTGPGIFAAGDVANPVHPFYGERVRVEHWDNALHQGPAAARSKLRSCPAAVASGPVCPQPVIRP